MAATSLAEQLKKLSVPESSLYKDDKRKASLLFNPKEAALKDRDTFYEIGISGLNELMALYEGFSVFEDSLFSKSSKDFERAVQSKDINTNLDRTIEKFLYQVSPYLLLQSSHKALEWLVHRYHIQQYNQDAIMALILPYHETKIFTRFIQLMDLKSTSNRWNWLQCLQKPGVALAKQVLHNQCASNIATLQFISKITLKYVQEMGERASQLNTVFAFFCSTTIGTINSVRNVTESMINVLLPTIIEALDSPINDFRCSSYVILGYLTTKAMMKENTIGEIVDKLLNSQFDVSYDMVLLTNLIYSSQKHVKLVSDAILYNLSVDTMTKLCEHLKKLIEQNINVQPFVITFLSSVLPVIQSDSEEFKRMSRLPEILLEVLDFKTQQPENVIKCILDLYQPSNEMEVDGNESDIEIIDEDQFSTNIQQWYSSLLKNLELKYPNGFDMLMTKELKSKYSKKRQKQLSQLLAFKPAMAHKVGNSSLFETLNHVNPDFRIQAVNYIEKNFDALKRENLDFVRESIVNRLNDEEVSVVATTLQLPVDYLKDVLSEGDLTNVFVNIISRDLRNFRKWKPVIDTAIKKFCTLDILPVTQDIVLAVMPLLFPYSKTTATVTWNIITSEWGRKFGLTKGIKGLNKNIAKDNHELLCQTVFKVLCRDRKENFNNILEANVLDKSKTTDVCFFLLLNSAYLKSASAEEITSVLNILLELVENREIFPSSDSQPFSNKLMPEFINLARQDKILFEFMEYIFAMIIEAIPTSGISKPWCNVCESADTVLVRRLYEICVTGCFIPTYGRNYASLLQKLLDKFCSNFREKFEFIANIACGHILYAADPKDVIGPELQLRSLKLLQYFITGEKDNTWILDTDVTLVMILLNLSNPLSAIRQCVIGLIESILTKQYKGNTVAQLLKELLNHKEELIFDHEQIAQVIGTVLTQSSSGNQTFRRNCLLRVMNVLIGDTPAHVTSEFLNVLSQLTSTNVFNYIIPSLQQMETQLKNDTNPKFLLDIYESKLARNVYSRINKGIVSAFDDERTWNSIATGLQEYRECILEGDQTQISPSVLIMRQIDEEVFNKLSEKKKVELISLICLAGAFSNNPNISSVAAKTIKKLTLNMAHIKPMLESMLNAPDPALKTPKKTKSSTIAMLSYQLVETKEWRLGITLLEYVQNKKRMTVDNSFVSILFQLLSRCLRFEEQSYVEYTKQLILSSVWYFCKKFFKDTDKDLIKSLKSVFDIELVVQCIRGTQNPQTQHHALILLSHAAYLLPEQVLHHTMEIFTFMGSSVLRHDDAYSFQIITKIIETLIPILVKLDRGIEDYTEKELQQLQKRVVPVLRIFADVVLHVPEHRRLPLYTKLIETLGASQFLWVFLGLLLETHVAHFNETKEKDKKSNRNLVDRESPINRTDFGQSVILEFPPEVVLENFIKLLTYVKTLPQQKDENSMETDVDPGDIFSVNGHTSVQLRHYKYVILTFLYTCLSSSRFIHHSSQASNIPTMEGHYKTFIVTILTFIQSISKVSDEKTAKYWRVMLHHSYDLLDHTNNLLSINMFLSVVRGLLNHTLHTVRRKAMELLNSKIQFSPEFFNDCDKALLYSLLPALLEIVKTIESPTTDVPENIAKEMELNQQTALLSLKLLTRMLASENPEAFKIVLQQITDYTCNQDIAGNVMASIVLCLAELCANLKAHALASLKNFMPALIKVLKKQRKSETPELVLLSTVTAIAKIVESLPLFLSPYLQKILYEYSILLAKWQSCDQECSKVSAIVAKLATIKKKLACSIPPRVFIPVVNQTHQLLLEKANYDAIGPVMSVLAESFANVTTADFTALQQDLTSFFLSALQIRSDAVDKDVDDLVIDKAEEEVVNALVCLVLKLSESNFRPFYFKIYDWAIRSNVEKQKDRAITFYRLSSSIAERLKGLFVLFAGHFIKNASDLLDACNTSKTETLYYDSEDKCLKLVNYILKTLQIVFLYDSQNFLNKERFETLMQSIVDQLENTLGGLSNHKTRAAGLLIPCISQFAVATADDSLWKLLNYQILLKTRHNDAEVRLTALACLVAMATQLGSSWLPLLAESVPFLAELMEDSDPAIEAATKEAARDLQRALGEPLDKYF